VSNLGDTVNFYSFDDVLFEEKTIKIKQTWRIAFYETRNQIFISATNSLHGCVVKKRDKAPRQEDCADPGVTFIVHSTLPLTNNQEIFKQ
jgi:hypothetical protein